MKTVRTRPASSSGGAGTGKQNTVSEMVEVEVNEQEVEKEGWTSRG